MVAKHASTYLLRCFLKRPAEFTLSVCSHAIGIFRRRYGSDRAKLRVMYRHRDAAHVELDLAIVDRIAETPYILEVCTQLSLVRDRVWRKRDQVTLKDEAVELIVFKRRKQDLSKAGAIGFKLRSGARVERERTRRRDLGDIGHHAILEDADMNRHIETFAKLLGDIMCRLVQQVTDDNLLRKRDEQHPRTIPALGAPRDRTKFFKSLNEAIP